MITLVPEQSQRTDLFKTATTDQNGQFVMQGIAPGN